MKTTGKTSKQQYRGLNTAADRGETDPNIALLRKKAKEALLKGKSGKIGEATVDFVHLGLPTLNIGQNSLPQPIAFTERATQEVVSTGYIKDGEVVLANKILEDKVRKTFVSRFSQDKKGMKIPIVLFKRGKHLIAFPITMNKTVSPKVEQLDTILSDPRGQEKDKIKEINNLLIQNKISPAKYQLTELNTAKIEAIRLELEQFKDFVTADELANVKYNKSNLVNDAQITLDLENLNKVLPSQKLSIDLESIILTETSEAKFNNLVEVENTLNDFAMDIDRFLRRSDSYIDSKGEQIEDEFRDVFDDVPGVNMNPTSHLDKLQNISVLKEAFEKVPSKFKKVYGADKIKDIEKAFKAQEFFKNQVKVEISENIKKDLEC